MHRENVITKEFKMAERVLLSPTYPPGGGSMIPPSMSAMGMPGFDNRVRKSGVRKVVDYHSSVIRYLEVSNFRKYAFKLLPRNCFVRCEGSLMAKGFKR